MIRNRISGDFPISDLDFKYIFNPEIKEFSEHYHVCLVGFLQKQKRNNTGAVSKKTKLPAISLSFSDTDVTYQ